MSSRAKRRSRIPARLLAVTASILLFACAPDPGPARPAPTSDIASETATTPADSRRETARAELARLTDDLWAYSLQTSTYLRLQEGLPIEELEDLTLAQFREDQAMAATFRERLGAIDESLLDDSDRVTWEILAFELEDRGVTDDDFWLVFNITPYVGPYAIQFGQQALQVQSITDQETAAHYLALAGELADIIDQLHEQVVGQVERGIYLPRPALPSVRATWRGLLAALPAAIRVDDGRLSALSAEEREAFHADVEKLIETRITAGLENLLSAIGETYEAQAPESVGLAQYPGGDAVYRRLIRAETTLDLSPAQIHARGLAAVDDISARMQAIRDELGFEGTAREFIEHIKVDPRFIAQSPGEVEQRYMDYIRRVEPVLDDYFRSRPAAGYGVRRLPLASEAGMTYGYYNPPTADDPVGYYNYNASELPTRSLIWAGSLIYHELLPGHHFHLATQNENSELPAYRRKYSVSAYTEGWAEYAASLGIEMGMYETPMELYGRYIGEMFLATRLVVDTGMNALGWSLEDGREFMRERVIQSDSEIASETLRYSTSIPAQALAYRLGYEKMWELRHRAENALGNAFDVRDYHDIVLSDGTKPLPVLEAKVDRWISAQPR